jgi:hypothetical protein
MNTTISSDSPRRENLVSDSERPSQIVINVVQPQAQNMNLSTEDVEKHAKRLKITSCLLVVGGAYSLLSGIGMLFNSRKLSNLILTGDIRNGWNKPPTVKLPPTMDRDELVFFDSIRNVMMVAILFSAMVLCTGKKALHAIKEQNSHFAARVLKCTVFKIAVMCCLWMVCKHISSEGKSVIEGFRQRHNITVSHHHHHHSSHHA